MAKKKISVFGQRKEQERLSDRSYLDDFLEESPKEETAQPDKEKASPEPPSSKRMTMEVFNESVVTFRNIVHTIKCSGDYSYAQKDAFARAVALLEAEVTAQHGPLQDAPPPRKGRW